MAGRRRSMPRVRRWPCYGRISWILYTSSFGLRSVLPLVGWPAACSEAELWTDWSRGCRHSWLTDRRLSAANDGDPSWCWMHSLRDRRLDRHLRAADECAVGQVLKESGSVPNRSVRTGPGWRRRVAHCGAVCSRLKSSLALRVVRSRWHGAKGFTSSKRRVLRWLPWSLSPSLAA
jgi:hypothetical protein